MTFHLRQQVIPRRAQDRLFVPGRARHKTVHGLMTSTHMPRIDLGRHRLAALALARQQQTP
jgi:hypothetical protein